MLTIKKALTLAILALALPATAPAQVLPAHVVGEILRKRIEEARKECTDRAFVADSVARARDRGLPLEETLALVNEPPYSAYPQLQRWLRDISVSIYTDPTLKYLPPEGVKGAAYQGCMAYLTGANNGR